MSFGLIFVGCMIYNSDDNLSSIWDSECCQDYIGLYRVCRKENNNEKCLKVAKGFINGKYKNDALLLQVLGDCYYLRGEYENAISYNNQALNGEYLCSCTKITGDSLIHDRAVIHFVLSKVYRVMGNNKKSDMEDEKAVILLKSIKERTYDDQRINQIRANVEKDPTK